MLVPPVAQSATGDRPVADTVAARGQQSTGPAATTTLWPLAPAQPNQVPNQQTQGIPSLAATPAPAHNQGANRYGLYSLFPGGGGGSYVAATPATPGPPTPARAYHATTHKVSESVFSAAVGVGVGGYTWGAPTPPPGSPYSPVPVTQLELLAKNLANLAPAGQQALSLQGVGVNVGSLHHAQHTQHTQHTLNLTGLHHLHHGGLQQNAFPPQLSLVTGGAPTLTINSFSSPTNSTNGVAPTTGVLLQEYESPAATAATGCTVTVNGGASGLTSSTASSNMMHGQAGGQTAQAAPKKREAFLSSQGQPVKLENKSTRTPCLCRNSNGKTKVVHSDVGCSRTLPIASSWSGQDGANNSGAASLVKREPMASVPCQVAEVSTSLHATTTSVKIEPVPPKSENGIVVSNAGAGGIPVGIAVARQRLQHQETSTSMRNVSLSHHTSHHASYHHFQPDSLGSSTAMAVGGTTLVHCGGPGGEDRAAHLAIPSGALAPSLSLNSSLNSSMNSTLGSIGAAAADTAAAWPPTLWQYPATAAAAMPTEPLNFQQMGVGLQGGLQLVRDPTSGHLLLIHAAEQMQQAVVWPNYANHGGSVAPPQLLLPPPPPSIQVLGDIGGARLVLAENKRKPPSALPIVKIEADCSNSPTTIISTSTESTKALQAVTSVTGALVPEAPLVTTLHYYPHAPALLQISQPEPTHCRSQATSPVSCLTPPPEVPAIHTIEPPLFGVQDASNQTDAPEDNEEPPLVKQEQNLSPCQVAQSGANLTTANFEIVASPERICNVVRITTTTTTVNPICGIVTKVDKAENTIINMADCAKYSAKDCRSVKTIEHDRVDEEVCKDDKVVCRESRIGTRIIEITEENCDSFHENLEFFARRRDIGTEQCDRQNSYSKDEEKKTGQDANLPDKVESKSSDITENTEAHRQVCSKTSEARVFDEPQPSADSTDTSTAANCESCDKNRNSTPSREIRPQITVKSFDMPNIDCDDQEVQHVVIKQEADDSCYEVGYDSSQCEPTSTSEKPRSQETTKRHSVEKSHPGIENVVEKLKKNAAAALQEAALPAQKPDESAERSTEIIKPRRYSETIPKKLHILRSCASSLDAVDSEVSSSQQLSEQCSQGQSRHSVPVEDDGHPMAGSKCDSSKEYLLNDNNNDSRSNNNNIKVLDDKKLFGKNEKVYDMIAHIKPKTIWSCEMSAGPFYARKFELAAEETSSESKSRAIKQKPTVDVSGLELLSNSIEQLEQGIGQLKHPQPVADIENSPVKIKPMNQQSENNNNKVNNPLVLLCALAEQKFREEVGDETSEKLNLENSEEISHAGRLLLNLGRGTHLEKDGKRKYPEVDDYHSKRFKLNDCEGDEEQTDKKMLPDAYYGKDVKSRMIGVARTLEEEALLKLKENSRHAINLSTENIDSVSDKEVIRPKEWSLNGHDENCYSDKRDAKPVKDIQVPSSETSDKLPKNDTCYDKKAKKESKPLGGEILDAEMPSEQSTNCEVENKKQTEERDVYDHKSPRAKMETKRFVARKSSRESENDWPNMDAMELDMRVRMADIQRQYREKQKELSKLIPKKDDKKHPGRPRKKSHSSSSDHAPLSSPPALDVSSSPQKSPPRIPASPSSGAAAPSLASTVLAMPRCNVNLVKLGEPKSHIKLLDSIPSIPTPVPPVASPVTVLPTGKPEDEEKSASRLGYDTSSPAPTVASTGSASKKRKVGRPKKFMCTSGSTRHLTETIVAKKPKSKSSLVGYVLSSKNRHLQTKQYISKTGYTPLPFKSGMLPVKSQSKTQKMAKTRGRQMTKPAKQTPLHNKSVISSIIAEKAKLSQEVKLEKNTGKIKPKLKAEVIVKKWEDDETDVVQPKEPAIEKPIKAQADSASKKELRHEKSKKKKRKSSASSSPNHDKKKSKRCKTSDCKMCTEDARKEGIVNRCKLTSAHLAIDQLRVLQLIGGLFYAGRLSAVQPPDVYAITLDGERGNKPHIYSREQILRDAIVEVCPSSTKELPPSTRLCAYWSEQYRCLYPGTAVEPIEPNPKLDEKYVSVEFDDGDSGRIDLDNIRLLPAGYPFIEYDPNPLLTLGKRRRQRSSSGEKLRSNSSDKIYLSSNDNFPASFYVCQQSIEQQKPSETEALEIYRERKRTKKRKRKLKRLQEGKKKHKKHKSEEHRKHKHRKHRKHKHKHHGTPSEASYVSGESSSAEQKSEEEVAHETPSTTGVHTEEKMSSDSSNSEDHSTVERQLKHFLAGEFEERSFEDMEAEGQESTQEMLVDEEESPDDALEMDIDENQSQKTDYEEDPFSQDTRTEDTSPQDSEYTPPSNEASDDPSYRGTTSEETSPNTESDVEFVPGPESVRLTRSMGSEAQKAAEEASRAGVSTKREEVPPEETRVSPEAESEEPISADSSESWDSSDEKKKKKKTKQKRIKRRTRGKMREKSGESRSKMAPFLPEKQLWSWAQPSYRKITVKGRTKKQFHRMIERSDEVIEVGDSAVFLSTSSTDRPYIGKITSMWETPSANMVVKVDWYYHPEERRHRPHISNTLKYPGGLFESNHSDENDVQTIAHKCEVLPLQEYIERMGGKPDQTVYENKDVYYLAGSYDPTTGISIPVTGVV